MSATFIWTIIAFGLAFGFVMLFVTYGACELALSVWRRFQ